MKIGNLNSQLIVKPFSSKDRADKCAVVAEANKNTIHKSKDVSFKESLLVLTKMPSLHK